jgi:asparagine synthase (glutamine-hydrolysing)
MVGPPGTRRAHLEPYLHSHQAATFLNRVRLADVSLKGSQNILPRMDRTSQCWGLDVRTPLFDRALAEASFRLPPQMKLHGACEKYVLKLALQKALPREIVWRRKYGMNVPITDWALGPLASVLSDLLSPVALAKRGLFRPDYVLALRAGQDVPGELRRRRIGERLWTLAMLEAWLRVFIDGKGREPG